MEDCFVTAFKSSSLMILRELKNLGIIAPKNSVVKKISTKVPEMRISLFGVSILIARPKDIDPLTEPQTDITLISLFFILKFFTFRTSFIKYPTLYNESQRAITIKKNCKVIKERENFLLIVLKKASPR